jgi:hypothetical protein
MAYWYPGILQNIYLYPITNFQYSPFLKSPSTGNYTLLGKRRSFLQICIQDPSISVIFTSHNSSTYVDF